MSGCSRWDYDEDEEYEAKKQQEAAAKKKAFDASAAELRAQISKMPYKEQVQVLKGAENKLKAARAHLETVQAENSLVLAAFKPLCKHWDPETGASAICGFEYDLCSLCGGCW